MLMIEIETAMMESPRNAMLPRGKPRKRKKRNIILSIYNSIIGLNKPSKEEDEEEIENGESDNSEIQPGRELR